MKTLSLVGLPVLLSVAVGCGAATEAPAGTSDAATTSPQDATVDAIADLSPVPDTALPMDLGPPDVLDVPVADANTPDLGPDVAPDTIAPLPSVVAGVTFIEVPTDNPKRTLPVAIWYPGKPVAAQEPYVYLGLLAGQAYAEVPLKDGGPYPVIVFSHGHQGLKEQSYFLTEWLAMHGFIVVAPDHVWNTFLTFDKAKTADVALLRPKDISRVIDRLEKPEPTDPAWLKTKLDLQHIGACGHSFGGYTTVALSGATVSADEAMIALCDKSPKEFACQLVNANQKGPYEFGDPRIDAAVPMAPAGFEAFRNAGLAKIAIPMLVLAGKEDTLTPLDTQVKPIFDGVTTDKMLWTLKHGSHFTFSDACVLAAFAPPDVIAQFGNICDEKAPLSITDAHSLVRDVVLSFFKHTLLGDVTAKAELTKAAQEAKSAEIEVTVMPKVTP